MNETRRIDPPPPSPSLPSLLILFIDAIPIEGVFGSCFDFITGTRERVAVVEVSRTFACGGMWGLVPSADRNFVGTRFEIIASP